MEYVLTFPLTINTGWWRCLVWPTLELFQRQHGGVGGETPERQGGAYMGFPERIDTILNRTEALCGQWPGVLCRVRIMFLLFWSVDVRLSSQSGHWRERTFCDYFLARTKCLFYACQLISAGEHLAWAGCNPTVVLTVPIFVSVFFFGPDEKKVIGLDSWWTCLWFGSGQIWIITCALHSNLSASSFCDVLGGWVQHYVLFSNLHMEACLGCFQVLVGFFLIRFEGVYN